MPPAAPPDLQQRPGFAVRAAMAAYSALLSAIVWTVLVPLTLARVAVRRARADELRERLWGAALPPRPRVLIHAVSAGEVNAAAPLVQRLARAGHAILLSTGTRSGRALAARTLGSAGLIERCAFLPWDRRRIARWLAASGIVSVVVVETEIWPNLFFGCADRGIPLFMVNATVSAGDARRYAQARWFFKSVLARAVWIGAKSNADRTRLATIGAPVDRMVVAGDLKFDAAADAAPADPVQPDTPPLVVATSTHAGEEDVVVACLVQLRRSGLAVRGVVAPRDTNRAGRVLATVRQAGLIGARHSEAARGVAASAWDVLVVDSYGDLSGWFARASVAVVGGTFVRVGGHSPIEAASRGVPVIVGPHVDRIAEIVDGLEGRGAAIRIAADRHRPGAGTSQDHVSTARALSKACATFLTDRVRRARAADAARQYCREQRGAADRCAAAITGALKTIGRETAATTCSTQQARRGRLEAVPHDRHTGAG